MFEGVLRNFNKQFSFEPKIENEKTSGFKKFIVLGMGGSNLASRLLKDYDPSIQFVIHEDYSLPVLNEEDFENSLIIASSYSGNTEEVIDGYKEAINKGLATVVISIGGELLELAKKNKSPYILLPTEKTEPRLALGWSCIAFAKAIRRNDILKELNKLSELKPDAFEEYAKGVAGNLEDKIPLIYSSNRNAGLVYTWKIKLNESGKVPAFANVFPEMNHNELAGFGRNSENFYFILLKDKDDNPRVQKRMEIFQKIYTEKTLALEIKGKTRLEKIFTSLILADWVSYYLAGYYGVDSEANPVIDEFKRLMK